MKNENKMLLNGGGFTTRISREIALILMLKVTRNRNEELFHAYAMHDMFLNISNISSFQLLCHMHKNISTMLIPSEKWLPQS